MLEKNVAALERRIRPGMGKNERNQFLQLLRNFQTAISDSATEVSPS
jgi:hypothetical protein